MPKPAYVRILKSCPMCNATFTPRVALTGRKGFSRSSFVGVIFCSRVCSTEFDNTIGGDPLLHDFGRPSAPDRRCRDCETPLAVSDKLDRCRLCRITRSVSTRFRQEAKRNAAFRALRDVHLVYIRKYGVKPMEIIE